MFTWICPKCGREVPPSMQDCPNCAPVAAAPPQPQPVAPPPAVAPISVPDPHVAPPPQVFAPPPPVAVPPPPVVQGYSAQATYQPSMYQQPPVPPSAGLPPWLITILVFAGLLGAGAIFYFYLLPNSKREVPVTKSTEVVAEEGKPAKTNSLGKQIEVTGIRITEDAKQKLLIRLLVINHSAADLGEQKLTITLSSDSGKGPSSVIGTFPVVVADLGPFEAKEAKGTISTTLRAYELPDWQFLRAKAELTIE